MVTESAVHRVVDDALSQVGDIDLQFEGDGYMMGFTDREYVHEIHAYLLLHERDMHIVNPFGLTRTTTSIDPRARAKLMDWMSGMHYTFRLAIESLFLAYQITDRYLSLHINDISRDRLELLGITVLFTASKFEESYTPTLRHFLDVVKNRYTRSQVSTLEFQVLEAIGLNLSFPTPITFIRRYAAIMLMDHPDRYRAFCIAELCLHKAEFMTVLPSELAAASCIVSMKIADAPIQAQWPADLESYTTHTYESLQPIIDMVLDVVAESNRDIYKYSISKYSRNQYYNVATSILRYGEFLSTHRE